MSSAVTTKPVTTRWVRDQKGRSPLTMLTAYDHPTAHALDAAGIDLLLVGDSVGTVIYGEPDTLGVTLEDILRHTRAVARAAKRAMVVADMPFLTYQASDEQAVLNAGRLLKEGRAQAVKLEGGEEYASTVRSLIRAGIPVMGHIGLMPQSIHAAGGYRMHGKTVDEATALLQSAQALADAGAFALVLECVEASLAARITAALPIPTIGIGSGPACDGQVLVTHDLLGLTAGHVPRFVTPVAQLSTLMTEGARAFAKATRAPAPSSSRGTADAHHH